MDSQDGAVDALQLFSRHMEGEKKVFAETRDAIHMLLRRASKGNRRLLAMTTRGVGCATYLPAIGFVVN